VYLLSQGPLKELDPKRNYAVTQEVRDVNRAWGVAEFDDATRHLYFTDDGLGVYRVHIDLNGKVGPREAITTTEWKARGGPLALAIHRPTGKLVLRKTGGGVFRIDPGSGRIEDLTVKTSPLPAVLGSDGLANRIYSKFVYVAAVDAFVTIDDPRNGVWVYRLPGTDPTPAPPPPPPPPAPSNQDFDTRCKAQGVVFCDPLDTEGPWGVDAIGNRVLMRNPDGSTGIPTTDWWRNWRGVGHKYVGTRPDFVLPGLDRNVKASGTGSLKFTYPSLSDEGGAGNFATNFSNDLSRQFGEGDTFYVQFRWRANCDFIYTDCNPSSPMYKKVRRAFRATAGGPSTAAKLTIISTGDSKIGSSVDACTWQEIVLNHGFDHALQAYQSCQWYSGFTKLTGENFFGSLQVDSQPNGTLLGARDDYSPTCWYIPNPSVNRRKEWGYTGPDCFSLEADEWFTVQTMIRIGTWQPNRAADGPPNSHVTVWAAREGQPQRVIIDTDTHLNGPEPSLAGHKYGKIWLLPFMTAKDKSEQHPAGHVWYDELIVSTKFIADPN
jgi:hypothetical protein